MRGTKVSGKLNLPKTISQRSVSQRFNLPKTVSRRLLMTNPKSTKSTSQRSLDYDKFNRVNLVNAMTRAYTWILAEDYPHREISPLPEYLTEMLEQDYTDLRARLLNAVIENVFSSESIIKLENHEKVLLTGFLLAPLFACADKGEWESLNKKLLSCTGFFGINWMPVFKFIKYCLVNPDKKALLKTLNETLNKKKSQKSTIMRSMTSLIISSKMKRGIPLCIILCLRCLKCYITRKGSRIILLATQTPKLEILPAAFTFSLIA